MAAPQIDPKLLLQAAMQQGAPAGASGPAMPGGAPATPGAPGDVSSAGAAPPPQAGAGVPQDPSQGGGGGGPSTGSMNNAQLSQIVGQGAEMGQDPAAIQQMMQMLQDPGLPPDQKAEIQMRLQLAALRSVAGGASGASGAPQGASS